MSKKKFLPKKVRLVLELAKATEGMVGGQVADMEAEGNALRLMNWSTSINIRPENCLNLLYLRVRYSDATEEQEEKLLTFAKYIGLAFQIRDDILDVEGTEEEIGKPIGSDLSNEKSTYTTLFTVDRAKDILEETIAEAKGAISSLQLQDEYLLSICDLIAKRNN